MAVTKLAGTAGARMSSAVGKAVGHIKRSASTQVPSDVLDPKVIRQSINSMAANRLSDADANFKRAVNRWGYSSDASYLGDDLDIIRQATRQSHITSDQPLYRGVRHASGVKEDSILAGGSDIVDWDKLQVGSEFRLGATSWSTSESVGSAYAQQMGTVLEMPAGSRGLKLGAGAEAEFVTEGKFRVASIDPGDLSRPRKVALERVEDNISGAIRSKETNISSMWDELNSLDATSVTVPRPKRPTTPTPDMGMIMQPRHSSARSGLPKRSMG